MVNLVIIIKYGVTIIKIAQKGLNKDFSSYAPTNFIILVINT